MYRLDEGERGAVAPRRNSGRGVAYWAQQRTRREQPCLHHHARLSAGRSGRALRTAGAGFRQRGHCRPQGWSAARRRTAEDPSGFQLAAGDRGDVVVAGVSFSAGGAPPSKAAVPGWVRGYDVRTGRLLWAFHTIPQPGEVGADTWNDDSASYTGNTAVWAPFSADAARGLVYLPVEAPTADFYGGHRTGNNLFSDSLVCIDARTGRRLWHYQIVHHDIWDYDLPAAPVLVDITVRNRRIPAVVQVTKMGLIFVFDRVTGKPVWPIEERAVPQTDVPGEQTSRTQPLPDPARSLRATGSAPRGPDRLHARSAPSGGSDRQGLPLRPSVPAAFGRRRRRQSGHPAAALPVRRFELAGRRG